MNRTACSLLALGLGACAPMLVDGFKLHEEQWRLDTAALRRRFAFEAACGEAPAFTALGASGDSANTVAVAGCGKRVVYKRLIPSGWVMDSSSGR